MGRWGPLDRLLIALLLAGGRAREILARGARRRLLGGLAAAAAVLGLLVGAYAIGYHRGEESGQRSAAPPAPPSPPARTQPTTGPATTAPATTAPATTAPAAGSAEAGKQVFASAGCGGCHTLAGAGATGTVGPNLDRALAGGGRAVIRQSIVDPNGQIAPGYQANVMPSDYGSRLSDRQIADLIALLSQ